jgi:hypothetical protein
MLRPAYASDAIACSPVDSTPYTKPPFKSKRLSCSNKSRRGDVFGEKALRDQTPTETPTYVATEYTKLACVSSEDYFQYIHEHMQDRVRQHSYSHLSRQQIGE